MFVLVSIIEALPGGTCSLVLLKYWLVSMFHVLFISLFSDNFVPINLAFSLSLEQNGLYKYTLTRERASLLRHKENSSVDSVIKCSLLARYYSSLPSDDVLGI